MRKTIPVNCPPHVRSLIQAMERRGMTWAELATESGISARTARSWLYDRSPTVKNLEACLNVLGLTLEVRHRL